MSSHSIIFDPSKRTVLPASEAVVRFRRRDWERAARERESSDPAPIRLTQPTECIVLEGSLVTSEFTTGGELVARRRFVAAFTDDAPLAIVPEVFQRDDSLAMAAAAALDRLATQRTRARQRAAVVVPAAPMWPAWVAAVVFAAAVAGWCWHVLH